MVLSMRKMIPRVKIVKRKHKKSKNEKKKKNDQWPDHTNCFVIVLCKSFIFYLFILYRNSVHSILTKKKRTKFVRKKFAEFYFNPIEYSNPHFANKNILKKIICWLYRWKTNKFELRSRENRKNPTILKHLSCHLKMI